MSTAVLTRTSVKIIFCLFIFSVSSLVASAQVVWNGSMSTDWFTAANWSPSNVPLATDDVEIPTGTANNCIINAAGAVAQSVFLNDATLTVQSNGVLTITNGETLIGIGYGIDINGANAELINTGTININDVETDGIGIFTGGVLTNNNGGKITISNPVAQFVGAPMDFVAETFAGGGIYTCLDGTKTINNSGEIEILNSNAAGIFLENNDPSGVVNFNNQSQGKITITTAKTDGIVMGGLPIFDFFGDLDGVSGGLGNVTFTNDGVIKISDVGFNGIFFFQQAGNYKFTNNDSLSIDDSDANGINMAQFGGTSTLENLGNDAVLTITNVDDDGLETFGDVTTIITNSGKINIGNSTSTIGDDGIDLANFTTGSTTTLTNTGEINIERIIRDGIIFGDVGTKTINNSGTINITDILGSDADAIFLQNDSGSESAIFNNLTNGIVNISNVADDGIDAFREGNVVYNNSGTTTITGAADLLIEEADFNNLTGGTIAGEGVILPTYFSSTNGTISPGTSPGIISYLDNNTFTEDFSSTTFTIEIDGTGNGGIDFDQIRIGSTGGNAIAQLGGTSRLNVIFNYTPVVNDQFQIFLPVTSPLNFNSTVFNSIDVTPAHTVTFDYNTGILTVTALVPVELTSFTAQPEKDQVQLKWQTASELNNQGFDIEKSYNGKIWETIGFVKGNGTTVEVQDYQFFDPTPKEGINYYRLKQIDFDGTYAYSAIEAVEFNGSASADKLIVFPNPTTNLLQYQLQHDSNTSIRSVQVLDLYGRQLNEDFGLDGQLSIENLSSGNYILVVNTSNKSYRKFFVKE